MNELDRKERKAIRMKLIQLLDIPNADQNEIKRLGSLLKRDVSEQVKTRKVTVNPKFVDPEKYIELRLEGKSQKEIADYFNCTLPQLKSELSNLRKKGVIPKGATKKGRDKTRLTKEEYLEYRKTISSDMKLAEILGVHHTTIKNMKSGWGLSGRHKKYNVISKDEYLEMKKQGMKDWEIEVTNGLHKYSLYKYKIKWGLQEDFSELLLTKEEFIEYSAKRWSLKKICKATGLSKERLRALRKKWGLYNESL